MTRLLFILFLFAACNKTDPIDADILFVNQRSDSVLVQCNGTGFTIPADTGIYRQDGQGSMRMFKKPYKANSIKMGKITGEEFNSVVESANFIK